MKKKLCYWILPAVVAGLAMGTLIGMLKIPLKTFMVYYVYICAALLAAAVAINLCYTLPILRKLSRALPLLEEGRPEEFLKIAEPLYAKAKGAYLRTVLALNLCAGYADCSQYERALEILLRDKKHSLRGNLGVLYPLNLCFCYFYLDRNDEALSIFYRYQSRFQSLELHRQLEGSASILSIYAAVAEGDFDLARTKLAMAKKLWNSRRFQADYQALEARLYGR